MRIAQLADGTYVKLLEPIEAGLIYRLNQDREDQQEGDLALQHSIVGIVEGLGQAQGDIVDLSTGVTSVQSQVGGLNQQVQNLEAVVAGQDPTRTSYTKSEMDTLLVAWRFEEIAHQYTIPSNEFFDQTANDSLKVGYAHFLNGRIQEPPTLVFAPFTMRRYTINLYFASQTTVIFPLLHDDHLVVYLNGIQHAVFEGANFSGAPDECALTFPIGWSTLQFLVANEHYGGGLDTGLELAFMAQAMNSLVQRRGMTHGNRVVPGTIIPEHLLQSRIYQMAGLMLTDTQGVGLTIGDDTYGAFKIGGCRVAKQDDGPLIVNSGMRIMGPLEVEDTNIVSDRRTSYLWEAEELGVTPGYLADDANAWNGKVWRVDIGAAPDQPIIQGPNALLRYGRYEANFRLKLGDAHPEIAVTLEAHVNGVGTLASRILTGVQFQQVGVFENFSLEFDYNNAGSPEVGGLELRVYSAGNHGVALDYVALQLSGS